MSAPSGASAPVLRVTASVRCAGLLDGPEQPLDVLGRMPAAIYLATRTEPSRVVAVLAPDAVRHPAGLVITGPGPGLPDGLRDGAPSASVGGGRLVLPTADGDVELRVGRWYDPVPRLGPVGRAGARAVVGAVEGGPVDADAGPARERGVPLAALARLEDALVADDEPAVVSAALALLGSGPGLTPSGDDMLAGLLATLVHVPPGRAAVRSVARLRTTVAAAARTRTTTISAELLRHALDGAVALPVEHLLRAVVAGTARGGGPSRVILEAVARVRTIGASSGRDLLAGIAVALRVAMLTDGSADHGRSGAYGRPRAEARTEVQA